MRLRTRFPTGGGPTLPHLIGRAGIIRPLAGAIKERLHGWPWGVLR